ncbi:hypothetical protein ABZ615_00175 [Streptomyces sp. NPDC007325]|uniref:hypothetical protein n=1 Tax=Streptomyces sp. NPDC007325 TaxID=3154588 RepID=UPI00340DCAD1
MVGGLGSAIGWFAGQGDYWKSFENFLIILGNWIAPWLAVMLVQRFLAPSPDGEAPRDFGPGFAAWLLGLLAAVPFMSQPGVFVGPIAEGHPALGACAAAVAFLTAGLIHYALTRNGRTRADTSTDDTTQEIPA